eukprot:3769591-Alexandrium_andersonii.AAC.1
MCIRDSLSSAANRREPETPPAALPGAAGAARSAAPPALGPAEWGCPRGPWPQHCLLYTSDAADDM